MRRSFLAVLAIAACALFAPALAISPPAEADVGSQFDIAFAIDTTSAPSTVAVAGEVTLKRAGAFVDSIALASTSLPAEAIEAVPRPKVGTAIERPAHLRSHRVRLWRNARDAGFDHPPARAV